MDEDTLHLNFNNHPTLIEILKYREHPSITAVTRSRCKAAPLYFSCIDRNAV